MTVNPRMWVAALRVIPRIDKTEFDRLDPFARWLIATRGAVLVMTFLSATLGGLYAALGGQFDAGRYLLVAFGLVVAHGASNLFNDYWDYKQGVDTDNYFRAQYGPHPLVAGLFTERQLLQWAIGTTAIPVAIGLYLAWAVSPWVLLFAFLGGFVMMAYAGKPFPLKYLGLGEPAVFLTWGPLMVGGSYFCITGTLPLWVVVASFPYALGTTGVIFGKHIDKIVDDTQKGIHTLPVLLGERRARATAIGIFALMYALVVPLVLVAWLPWLVLLVFLTVPRLRLAVKVFQSPKPAGPPEGFPKESWPLWFVGFAFILNRDYGGLFMVSLLAAVVVQALGLPAFVHL
jgi:1,4-dihydroxy-2-naphthoate octaprenyltransferase